MTMPWSVTLGGIRYQGRPLSGEAVRQFAAKVEAAGENKHAQESALTALLRLAFPLSWAALWKGDPVRKILRDPDRQTILAGFYASLRTVPRRPGSPMSGTASRP
jgi:hypothetical protein